MIYDNPFETRLSDILFHENDPSTGVAREDVNITPQEEAIPAGTVVFRALSDLTSAGEYTVLTTAGKAALVADNEFGVVIGDQFGFRSSFVPKAVVAKQFNAVVLKRGNIQLKDTLIKASLPELPEADFDTLKELLKRQGVILEVTV